MLVAQGHFAFPIVQQPKSNPWYVSPYPNEITQFSKATNVTLLAHNYLAGEEFYELEIGDRLFIQNDSHLSGYSVYAIDYYEIINPKLYRNLETGKVLGANSIIERYYRDTDLTLQTCIERGGNYKWGIMFVVGIKADLSKYPTPK